MVTFPVLVILILTLCNTIHARHTSDLGNAQGQARSPPQVDSVETSAEENTNPVPHNKYRLDYDGLEDFGGPFASYQFENGVRHQPLTSTSSSVNLRSNGTVDDVHFTTTTQKQIISITTARTPSTTTRLEVLNIGPNNTYNRPVSTVNPEEDENEAELVISTTPFKVDSLGSVVKINNTEDDESSEEQCDEGEVKRVKCNTCVCTDGSYFCSKKNCTDKSDYDDGVFLGPDIYNDDAAVQLIMEKVSPVFGTNENSNKNKNANSSNDKNIKNKWSWKKKQPAPVLAECTNGMTKTVDCNNCLCAKGKWACTKSACIALTLREKASYTDGSVVKKVEGLKENHHLDEDCLEGATRQVQCNQCVCHYNSWSCTNHPCPTNVFTKAPTHIKDIEEACQVEGDVKSKECNICRCKRGMWVCSTNNCMKFGVAKLPYAPPKFRTGGVGTVMLGTIKKP